MTTPPSPLPALGDRYRALFPFAAGGMAELFVGEQRTPTGVSRPAVIKRMLPHLAQKPHFVDMFLDEGRLAAMVRSPHVVTVYDADRGPDGAPFLVMELVIGASLSELLRRAARREMPVPIPVAVEIVAQVARGLHDAHRTRTPAGEPLELVHRDVSPHNILLDANGYAKITDFGIARALERVTHTETGEIKGKLAYMSPEQARAQDVDARTDVYALGVVAWELLALRRAFHGTTDPILLLGRVAQEGVREPPSLYRPAVRGALDEAVMRALARDPSERWADAGAMAEALRSACPESHEAGPSAVAELVRELAADEVREMEARVAEHFGRGAAAAPVVEDAATLGEDLDRVAVDVAEAGPPDVAAPPSRPRWVAPVAVLAIAAAGAVIGVVLSGLVGAPATTPEDEPPTVASPTDVQADVEVADVEVPEDDVAENAGSDEPGHDETGHDETGHDETGRADRIAEEPDDAPPASGPAPRARPREASRAPAPEAPTAAPDPTPEPVEPAASGRPGRPVGLDVFLRETGGE